MLSRISLRSIRATGYLTQIASICGTDCREYVELKEVIEGTRVY